MGSLPKRIKVGCRTYGVIFPYVFQEDCSRVGQECTTLCEIRVAGKTMGQAIPHDSLAQILFHEVLHAILEASNLGILGGLDDEAKVDGLSEWLCMVLRDNPEFTKLFLVKP